MSAPCFSNLLLYGIAEQDGAVRKPRLTGSVLRMEVRGREEQLRIARREPGGDARDRRTISRGKAGVHHKRRMVADEDRNVREAGDFPDALGNTGRILMAGSCGQPARAPAEPQATAGRAAAA